MRCEAVGGSGWGWGGVEDGGFWGDVGGYAVLVLVVLVMGKGCGISKIGGCS